MTSVVRCQLFNNSIVFIKQVSYGGLFGTEKRTRKASYCTIIYGIDPKVNSGADWWKSCISASFLKIINIFPFFFQSTRLGGLLQFSKYSNGLLAIR